MAGGFPLSFFKRNRLKSLLVGLEVASAPLAVLSAEIEERFLACGRALHDQAELTTRLSEQGARLKAFSQHAEHNDTALRRVSRLILAHLSLSDEFAREVERIACSLDDYTAHLLELHGDQQQLERSFAPMRFLHSFFRIESAALPAELQALFHAVTAEMQRLYTDVSASFREHENALADTRLRASIVAQQLHAQSSHLIGVVSRKRAEVQASLTKLEVELTQADQRNERLDSAISDLNREIDAITVSLQYQDITRQKIEHVQMAARNVLEQLADASSTPFRQPLRPQQVLCEVQAVQLEGVQKELESATGTIKSGLGALLERLSWIERECLSLGDLKNITANMDAVTGDMIAVHRLTGGLVHDALTTLTQAVESTRRFADVTIDATDTMRPLARDLHLIGLNAQVQAVQAKNGSLEVLSGAASAISKDAGALSCNFEAKLTATTEEFRRLIEREEAFYEKTRAKHTALQADDAKIFDVLNHELETGKALVTEVGSLLRRLKGQADELLPSVDLADFSRSAIADAREAFTLLAAACAEGRSGDRSDDRAILAELHSRYTMNSERAAHAAAIGMQPASTSRQAESRSNGGSEKLGQLIPAGNGGEETLGDNVELF